MAAPAHRRRWVAWLACWLGIAAVTQLAAQTAPKKEEKKPEEEVVVMDPFTVEATSVGGYAATNTMAGSRMGATVGGAKDARYFRDAVAAGELPHPNTITAEGLFSEHDLPARAPKSARDLFALAGEGMRATLLERPDVRYLAQIGLSSGLDAATWRRRPLNLVAVVDKSGSMNGAPLALVKRSLHRVLAQLGPEDQLSIVLYGDRSHVHLGPTRTNPGNRDAIAGAIDAITSAGSTNMEAGLRVGYELARASQRQFDGITRVMQFTDERPNVGDTSAAGFMNLMRAASRDGIGQTTVGVGVQFDAELASTISAVRGGNLFYFPEEEAMEKTFAEEFDTMVSELAYELDLAIRPAPGLRVAGVYGIPGELLSWDADGSAVRLRVETVFLSRKRGAIFVALAPADGDLPEPALRPRATLASVELSYRLPGRETPVRDRIELPLVGEAEASVGLQRGRLLVSEYLAVRAAMEAHHLRNDQTAAFRSVAAARRCFANAGDATLAGEREFIAGLYRTLAELSGHSDGSTRWESARPEREYAQRRRWR